MRVVRGIWSREASWRKQYLNSHNLREERENVASKAASDLMFLFPKNGYVEILILSGMVLGGGAFVR